MKTFKEFLETSIEEDKNPTRVKLPVAEKILKRAGYSLNRSGKHNIWKHSDSTKPHFALPGHPSKEISPAITRQIFALAESLNIDIREEE